MLGNTGLQNSLSSRQVQNLSQSLKSKSNDLLANIRISHKSNDIDNISTHISSQTGSPRSSLQGESPRSSLHRTSVESDSEILNYSSSKNSTFEANLNLKDNKSKDNDSFSVPFEKQDNDENKLDTVINNSFSDQNENGIYEQEEELAKANGNDLKSNDFDVCENTSNEDYREIDAIDNQKSSIAEPHESSKNFQLIIEQRERQLTSAIEQNASLNDTVEGLKLQLKELEEIKDEELKIMKNHIGGLENRLSGANKVHIFYMIKFSSKELFRISFILSIYFRSYICSDKKKQVKRVYLFKICLNCRENCC
jgi:hypothetical protein